MRYHEQGLDRISRRQFLKYSGAVGAALVAGHSLTPSWAAAALQENAEGKFGGIFTAATQTPPPTLDVMTSLTAASREATWFTLETLITYGEDYTIIPLLAQDWAPGEDGLTYTFNLRQGVPFHNGKELKAEDVVASLDRFFQVAPRVSQFSMMDSYEASGDYSVSFKLKYPSLAFLDALAYPVAYTAILPKEIIEGKEAGALEVADIVGTGPYKLVEWKPDQLVRYERFDEYTPLEGPRSGLGGGKIPYFDEIRLASVPETGSRIAGLETGEYDFAQSPATTDFDALEANPETVPHILEDNRWVVILFNFRNAPSNNLKFRQAVQAVADMDAISMAIMNGRGEFFRVQPSLWFPSSPWYNEEGAALYNQKDVEKSKQLLAESGYAGEEIVLVTNRNYDYMFKAIVTLEEQLKSLDIKTKVEVLDWPGQQAKWEEADTWHISTTGYLSQAIFAPDSYAAFYGGGGANAGAGYNNEAMTAAFDQAYRASSLEERKAAFANVQRIFHEDVAGLKVSDNAALDAVRAEIQNFAPWYNTTRFWSCWRDE